MMNFIYSIPENIGWVLVGMVACLCIEAFGLLIGTVIQAIKERMEDDEVGE